MLKYKSFIKLAFAGLLLLSGCEKYLDRQPDDMLTLDKVFSNKLENIKYLASVYSYLPSIFDPYNNLTAVTDEADFVWTGVGGNNINRGDWSPTYIPYDRFSNFYRAIRSATVYMSRGGECKECDAESPGITKQYMAEARAMRAWYYALLLQQYGPVAIISTPISVDSEVSDLQIPRNSYDEVVDFIVSELDAASADLPLQNLSADFGRVNKKVAMAMKSRVLLYAASPLWNGNTDFASFKNLDGKQLVNQTYDANKWKKAADAAKAVIDLMPNGLYKKNNAAGVFDPKLSYQYLSIDRWNKEIIWARNGEANNWEHHLAIRQISGWNGVGVTQQMVDAYHMSNGKRIDEQGSGYVETGFSTVATEYAKAGTWNMYVNREPRFYANVTYNGAEWIWKGENGLSPIKVELYNTGRAGAAGSHDHSETGYLLHRFINPGNNIANWVGSPQHEIYFRLADLYLSYAEALNEVSPGNADILKYVNLVRERGGIPTLQPGGGQAVVKELIHHERRIEMAFEQHRVWDTRRWKIAEQTDGGPMWGMNVRSGSSFADVSFYTRRIFETRVFQKKHYLWPIPQSEVERNKAWVQNPGW